MFRCSFKSSIFMNHMCIVDRIYLINCIIVHIILYIVALPPEFSREISVYF